MNPEEKDEVIQLYLDDIIPNRFQPREVFDERALKELAISIKEHGVIQPIIVRSVNGKYEIIAGERRYKASALAGLTKIPAIVRELDDKESSKVALLENLQRKNLNPIEEARTYQKILEIDQMTQEELAKTMGKSQSSIANKIRLLSLPDEIQNSLLKEEISERHARSLLNVPTQEDQKALLNKIKETKMSVRALEEEIKQRFAPAPVNNSIQIPENSPIPENNPIPDSNSVPENSPIPAITPPSNSFINPTSAIPEMVPSTNSYVNTQPLMPTAEMPIEDTSNYGKVTIAPPIGEEETMNNKFINFGEVHKEEEKEQDRQAMEALNLSPGTTSVDINEITENTSDIPMKKKGSADLDNLLNLGNPSTQAPPNKFISSPEKDQKEGSKDKEMEKSDYFQISELSQNNPFTDTSIMSLNNPAITANLSND